MRVRAGWNTKWGERKFDFELDTDDLKAVLQDNGLPPDVTDLTVAEQFTLLRADVEAYSRISLLRTAQFLEETPLTEKQIIALKAEIRHHLAAKEAVIARLRERL